MKSDLVIIIQGPSTNVIEQKRSWAGFNIIWSTWIGEETKYEKNDIVLFNKLPSERGIQNIALQRDSTLNGINKAKELGYKRVLKWRSDLLPSNAQELVKTFKTDCLNFLTWHNVGKYFVDYFIEGEIEDVYKIWDISTIYGPYSEKITTDNIFSLGFNRFNFVGDELSENNEIFWTKYKIKLSTYKNENCYSMKVIN
jgi:hypothetical protein